MSEGLETTLQTPPWNEGPAAALPRTFTGCTVLSGEQRGQGRTECEAKAERVLGGGGQPEQGWKEQAEPKGEMSLIFQDATDQGVKLTVSRMCSYYK